MIGWLDASVGASGDLLLGALVDAAAALPVVQAAVDAVAPGVALRPERVRRAGLSALRVHVDLPSGDQPARSWADIRALLGDAPLEEAVRDQAGRVFERLARAEGRVHGVEPDDVHFHEVGALDSIADVVGVCAAYADLGAPTLTVSPVAVGSGFVDTQHGRLPLPAPATVAVLADAGAPIIAGPIAHEACTPTGAALLAELASAWGGVPAMVPGRTGIGAAQRDPAGAANVTRLLLGSTDEAVRPSVVLSANVDDQDPRLWPVVLDRLLAAGAADAWLAPILMKKGRPAHTLHVLCAAEQVDALSAVVFAETTTIGLRVVPVQKRALDRSSATVEVAGQPVGVKVAFAAGRPANVSVELDDARAAAEALGWPLKRLLAAATAAALERWD